MGKYKMRNLEEVDFLIKAFRNLTVLCLSPSSRLRATAVPSVAVSSCRSHPPSNGQDVIGNKWVNGERMGRREGEWAPPPLPINSC